MQALDWACVFDRLSACAFERLRSLLGDGVPIEEFCEILLDACSGDDPDVAVEPLRSEILRVAEQLFLRIDISGNGDVSWDEFSHYVVHAVQAGNEVNTKNILQHVVYPASHEKKLDCPRLKKTVLRHISPWDKYCFLEVQTRQRSVLSLYKSNGDRIRLYAQATTEQVVEDITFCDNVNMLCLTTVCEKLQFYSLLEDPVLAESGQLQSLSLSRDHYLEGRHPVLRYDPETALLFAGGSNGTVSLLDPSNDFAVLPPLLQKVRMHGIQPVIDLVVLPERGRKMMLSSGLDGKIQTYDIVREEFFGELGSQVGAHSMSFANEFSMLVTCSNTSLDPLVWAPHAASNPFVCRLVDDRFGSGRGRLVECYCPPQTTYAFTADSTGLIKLWDMRQLRIVRAFMADARSMEDESDPDAQLMLRGFTASNKLSVLSCCRSKTGSSLYFAKADNVPERNPVCAHDDPVVSVNFAASADYLVTASKDCVKLWDINTGTVVHHLVDFWQGSKTADITSCVADDSGRRFYLGTESGVVSIHSTLTCGMIGECASHACSVFSLVLCSTSLFSAGVDGSVHVSNVSGGHPEILYAVRLDQERRTCCFDACGELKLAVVGDSNGVLTFYDCWPPANGSVSAVSRPARDPNAQSDASVDPIELSPHVLDATCVTFAGRQPFAAFGDVQGRLGIVATRPHPLSGTRLCAWRSFYPRASQTIVAVPLSLAYDEESEMLVVGDDQGNLTVWSCSNVVNAYLLSAVSWPMSIAERLALPTPTEQPLALSPRFVANFRAVASEASNPVRAVRVAYDSIFAVVENAVALLDCSGKPLGSMMQGRGMGLDGAGAPYTFSKDRSDDEFDREPNATSDAMPRALSTVPTLSRLKRSMSVFRPR